jgi:hypothetical protein
VHRISVGLVYLVAAKTKWLPENPMLWFVMMLMPAGPSAMKVMVLADVADAEHKDKMIIAKFLAVSIACESLPKSLLTCCRLFMPSLL